MAHFTVEVAFQSVFGALVSSAVVFAITRRIDLAGLVAVADYLARLGCRLLRASGREQKVKTPNVEPFVIWFTGLSGSGKTTLAKQLVEHLSGQGLRVEYLDGDGLRSVLPAVGFTREARNDHIRRTALMASYLQKHGVCVVTALISPYAESREFARHCCRNFVEVFLSTPLEECERRDVKGLYVRARQGAIRHFTGIDDPYELPAFPEITIDTSKWTMPESMKILISYIETRMGLSSNEAREVPSPLPGTEMIPVMGR